MKDSIAKILYTASAVLFAFIVFFGTLLYIEYKRTEKINPLNSQLESIKAEIKNTDITEEKLQVIRNLDYLYRVSWFRSSAHFQLGSKIIITAVIILAVFLQIAHLLKDPSHNLKLSNHKNSQYNRSLAVTIILILIILSVSSSMVLTKLKHPEYIKTPLSSNKSISGTNAQDLTVAESVKWTGFRGSTENRKQKLPTTWTNTASWKTAWELTPPLQGFSSPICTESKIIITGASESELAVFCYSYDSELLWELRTSPALAEGEKMPEVTEDTGYAASTPCTDGKYIWAIYASGDLICCDLNGNIIWRKKLPTPDNMYGYSSSLLKYKHNLIVQYDDYESQILYNLEPENGQIKWKKSRAASISWATPTLIQTNGEQLISIVTSSTCEGYQLETGKQQWFHEIMSGEVAPSSAYNGTYVVNACDNAVASAIDPISGKLIWQNYDLYMPDVACPIIFDKMVYMFTSGATVLCVDELTGEQLWEEELPDGFYSSPLIINDLIINADMQGNMYIIEPDREKLKILAEISLNEPIVTTSALSGKSLIARTFTKLMKIDMIP